MINWKRTCWMLVLSLLLGNTMNSLQAQDADQALDLNDNAGLDVEVSYLREADHPPTIDEVLKSDVQSQFLPGNQKKHLLSKSNNYWIRIRARRKLDSGDNYYLEVGFPTLDRVVCYGVDGSEVVSIEQSGDELPFSERAHSFRNHLFLLQFPDTTYHTYYLKVRSTGNMTVPIHFFEVGSYSLRDNLLTLEVGMGLGLMLIAGIYALILGFSIRERSYFFFALYTFTVAIFIATRSGIGSMYLWPQTPLWNDRLLYISVFLFLSFSALFSNYFLDVRSYAKVLSKIFILEASIHLSMALLIIFGVDQDLFPRLGMVGTIHFSIMLAAGIVAWLKGKSEAKIYTVGMFLYVVLGITHLLALYGYLPDFFTQLIVMRLGWYFEVIFLTIAVGRNYGSTIRENERLNSLKIKTAQELHSAQQSYERSRMEASQKDRRLMIANMERQQHLDSLEKLKTRADDAELKHKIDRLIATNEFGNSQWESFKKVFAEIHPHFFEELTLAHPQLTTNDLRHFAFIKLDLSLKEIADITGVSVQAVKMARNRLRKKTNITGSLTEYVRML
ncbi:MAG: 7TM diverse intracellular signaling domain-containing protein [Cyclobacteriaceae bacterium]